MHVRHFICAPTTFYPFPAAHPLLYRKASFFDDNSQNPSAAAWPSSDGSFLAFSSIAVSAFIGSCFALRWSHEFFVFTYSRIRSTNVEKGRRRRRMKSLWQIPQPGLSAGSRRWTWCVGFLLATNILWILLRATPWRPAIITAFHWNILIIFLVMLTNPNFLRDSFGHISTKTTKRIFSLLRHLALQTKSKISLVI